MCHRPSLRTLPRSDRFTCIDSGDDGDYLRQLRFYLEHYQGLKRAVRAAELEDLLKRLHALGPTKVWANSGWGAFDFQLDSDEFGTLPAEDRAILAGKRPRDAAVQNLTGGLVDDEGLTIFELDDGDE